MKEAVVEHRVERRRMMQSKITKTNKLPAEEMVSWLTKRRKKNTISTAWSDYCRIHKFIMRQQHWFQRWCNGNSSSSRNNDMGRHALRSFVFSYFGVDWSALDAESDCLSLATLVLLRDIAVASSIHIEYFFMKWILVQSTDNLHQCNWFYFSVNCKRQYVLLLV